MISVLCVVCHIYTTHSSKPWWKLEGGKLYHKSLYDHFEYVWAFKICKFPWPIELLKFLITKYGIRCHGNINNSYDHWFVSENLWLQYITLCSWQCICLLLIAHLSDKRTLYSRNEMTDYCCEFSFTHKKWSIREITVLTLMLLVANLAYAKWCKKPWKMTETLANG